MIFIQDCNREITTRYVCNVFPNAIKPLKISQHANPKSPCMFPLLVGKLKFMGIFHLSKAHISWFEKFKLKLY